MTNTTMDIALAVEQIYPPQSEKGAAQFLEASTYEALVETWSDERPIPTLAELEAAWEQVQVKQAAVQQAVQERDAMPLFQMDAAEIATWADAQDTTTFKREMAKAFVQLRDMVLASAKRPRNRQTLPVD
jgi:hypothetical protein